MEFLTEVGLFAIKTILIASSIVIAFAFLLQLGSGRGRVRAQIEIEKLNTRFRSLRRMLQSELLGKKQFKALMKVEKKEDKKLGKAPEKPSRVFVLDFDGDIRASQTESLREEVTAILAVAKPEDEVVIRLESGGGLVTSYGLAASQLARLRAEKIRLTICVDKIAASGGYMMACVGDRILAAPFAVLGSIGVIAQVPNFNKLLRKHDVDYREVTAGDYKRTVTLFGEISEAGMAKFRQQIEETHVLFKNFVLTYRPKVDLVKVATGEHWYGTQAIELGLADEIITSDDYLGRRMKDVDVYRVRYQLKKKLVERLSESAASMVSRIAFKLWSDLERSRF